MPENKKEDIEELVNGFVKSSIFFYFFGGLIIIFSFINFFSSDLIRFFLGILGGSSLCFFGYFLNNFKMEKQRVNKELEKIRRVIIDFRKDFATLNNNFTDLKDEVYKLKEKKIKGDKDGE